MKISLDWDIFIWLYNNIMKEIIISFDIDGTLISNTNGLGQEQLNIPIFQLITLLSSMKNTKIIVWSGGGQDYAEQIVKKYGVSQYIERCFDKSSYDEALYGKVDIAFDDIHEFSLADKNIIVRMK